MRIKTLVLLAFLSAGIPELLTGSTPYWEFINPINLGILLVVYGLPAIIYRELMIKWKLEYWELLVIGLIQGIYIEGVLVNTFFDPREAKMGVFSTYGRILGVNWPWAFYITFFHSIFSVTVPIMLTDSIFLGQRGKSIVTLNKKTMLSIIIVLGVMGILFNMDKNTYTPPIKYHIASIMGIALVYYIVKKKLMRKILIKSLWYPYRKHLLVIYPPLLIIVLFYGLQQILPPVLHILLGLLFFILLINTLRRNSKELYEDPWKTSIELLYGLIITALLVVVLNNQTYILPPTIIIAIIIPAIKKTRIS